MKSVLVATFVICALSIAPVRANKDNERREAQHEMDRANDRFYWTPQREREQRWQREFNGNYEAPIYDYQPPRHERW